ncbi:uncharacterized protein GGS22DRAFT_151560 [Annulohypoxylon maeteangense]|uniref:uncharacterized protein n=1 Tax=Annulohypoxylon maeteangense TaxID=1927788 RepID=UPI002007B3E6|nr:uncharacterized protein GGS22DRAFT_151560 [Annulohypoxylon maeteangense]KAI0890675.1 hypothetical protein GGS22DRAFT_151560 [Annulohypoxylon maeteangense]
MNSVSSIDDDVGSLTSTELATPIVTPRTSRANSISQSSSANLPAGPLNLTMLSTTSWRQPYPSVGQFAMTESEEVVATGPNGLFYFLRIRDHAATPWSEPRPFPNTQVTLNELTVSGLALYSSPDRPWLHLFCVSGGVLYSFQLTDKKNPSFIPDTSPPLAGYRVTGSPTIVQNRRPYSNGDCQSLFVPCQSGGLLHTPLTYLKSHEIEFGAVNHLGTELGIISTISVIMVDDDIASSNYKTNLVAICISGGQLNVIEGSSSYGSWNGKTSRILHPGEVTGNPVLIADSNNGRTTQFDLLVPSAEGGIFHFIRTESAPNEWHMIGRIAFPQDIPPATCLSFHSRQFSRGKRELYALIQIGGRLYHIKTSDNGRPWSDARLNPIVYPGPFFE